MDCSIKPDQYMKGSLSCVCLKKNVQFCKIAYPISSKFHSGLVQALLINLNVMVLMQWLNFLMVENQSIE